VKICEICGEKKKGRFEERGNRISFVVIINRLLRSTRDDGKQAVAKKAALRGSKLEV
jgi:hypothetical protein